MCRFVACGLVLLGTASLLAQEAKQPPPAKRYGTEPDLQSFPQTTPQQTLGSVLAAIGRKRFDYLLAHLTDPQFVDERVRRLGGSFEELVKETAAKLTGHPEAVQELYRFLQEGDWEVGETNATAQLKEVKDRRVFLRKLTGRWYLENRQKPAAPTK